MEDKQDILNNLRASIAAMEASKTITLSSSSEVSENNNPNNLTTASFKQRNNNNLCSLHNNLVTSTASTSDNQASHSTNASSSQSSTTSYSAPSSTQEAFTPEDALSKILRLVNHREHSTNSLRKRLRQAGFEDYVTESALARAQELGLVDDIRFGNILVRSRISQQKGCQGIERELIQEGINPEDIEAYREYRDEIAPQNEVDQAVALLKKHPPKAKNFRESAYRKLRQKGYDNSTAHDAIRIWIESLS